MPRIYLFRICCLFVVGALTLAPALMAVPSPDLHDESTIHKPMTLKGFFLGLWQTATRVLQPQSTALKSTTYMISPYPPYLPYVMPAPDGGGAGATLMPDGVSYTGN